MDLRLPYKLGLHYTMEASFNKINVECGPRDGHRAEYSWRPLLNAAKFG